jgi:hypothetical protein
MYSEDPVAARAQLDQAMRALVEARRCLEEAAGSTYAAGDRLAFQQIDIARVTLEGLGRQISNADTILASRAPA